MPGQFINTGTTTGGNLKVTNTSNRGKLNLSLRAYSFTLTSADITSALGYNSWNGNDYPAVLGTDGVDGFTLTFYSGQPSYLTQAANVPYLPLVNSPAIAAFFVDLATRGVLTSPTETTIWNAEWGPGSTYATGVVSMDGIAFVDTQMYIAPLDTTDPTWNQPGNNTTVLPGTYLFPATFTLIQPVFNKGGWC